MPPPPPRTGVTEIHSVTLFSSSPGATFTSVLRMRPLEVLPPQFLACASFPLRSRPRRHNRVQRAFSADAIVYQASSASLPTARSTPNELASRVFLGHATSALFQSRRRHSALLTRLCKSADGDEGCREQNPQILSVTSHQPHSLTAGPKEPRDRAFCGGSLRFLGRESSPGQRTTTRPESRPIQWPARPTDMARFGSRCSRFRLWPPCSSCARGWALSPGEDWLRRCAATFRDGCSGERARSLLRRTSSTSEPISAAWRRPPSLSREFDRWSGFRSTHC